MLHEVDKSYVILALILVIIVSDLFVLSMARIETLVTVVIIVVLLLIVAVMIVVVKLLALPGMMLALVVAECFPV